MHWQMALRQGRVPRLQGHPVATKNGCAAPVLIFFLIVYCWRIILAYEKNQIPNPKYAAA
jgi:hypothetical protein